MNNPFTNKLDKFVKETGESLDIGFFPITNGQCVAELLDFDHNIIFRKDFNVKKEGTDYIDKQREIAAKILISHILLGSLYREDMEKFFNYYFGSIDDIDPMDTNLFNAFDKVVRRKIGEQEDEELEEELDELDEETEEFDDEEDERIQEEIDEYFEEKEEEETEQERIAEKVENDIEFLRLMDAIEYFCYEQNKLEECSDRINVLIDNIYRHNKDFSEEETEYIANRIKKAVDKISSKLNEGIRTNERR